MAIGRHKRGQGWGPIPGVGGIERISVNGGAPLGGFGRVPLGGFGGPFKDANWIVQGTARGWCSIPGMIPEGSPPFTFSKCLDEAAKNLSSGFKSFSEFQKMWDGLFGKKPSAPKPPAPPKPPSGGGGGSGTQERETAGGGFPVVPVAIGGAALLGLLAFFALRR